MTEMPEKWQLNKLSGNLGAEITGIKLAQANSADIQLIKRLLVENMVLFFPNQSPTVEEHTALGRHFGPLEGHPNLAENSELPPEIFELRASAGGIADEWHTDLTCQDNPVMSILHMVTCPAYGGDTMWSNLAAAYDELSEPMQSLEPWYRCYVGQSGNSAFCAQRLCRRTYYSASHCNG